MNLAASLSLNGQPAFVRGLEDAKSTAASLRATLGNLVAPLAAAAAGFASMAGVIGGFRKAIGEAARMEGLETSFTTLLGSLDAAKRRMADLSRFAAATPFELPEIAQASKLLQAFTGNALSTSSGLRLVGDAAAAVGQPLEAVSMWFGRLHAALAQGAPLGEPIQNLTQLGLITNDARKQLMGLQGTALDGARTMQVLQSAFGANAGAMERLSRTYNGKLSTMRDAINATFRAFGEPIRDALKPVLDRLTSTFEGMEPIARRAGAALASALTAAFGGAQRGQLAELVGLALTASFQGGLNVLFSGLRAGLEAFSTTLGVVISNFDGVTDVLVGAASQFGAALLKAAREPLAYIQAAFEQMFDADNWDTKKRAMVQAREDTMKKWGVKDYTELTGRFGSFTRTAEEDRRLERFGAEERAREAQLLKQFGAVSVGDRARRILAEGGPQFGFGGDSMNAAEIQRHGQAMTAEGIAKLRRPVAEAFAGLGELMKGFRVEDFTGFGGTAAKLQALAKELGAAAPAGGSPMRRLPAPGADGSQSEDAAKAGKGRDPVGRIDPKTDQLRRIGGYIGFGGLAGAAAGFVGRGPALDYARRTAAAVEKLVDRFPRPDFGPRPQIAGVNRKLNGQFWT